MQSAAAVRALAYFTAMGRAGVSDFESGAQMPQRECASSLVSVITLCVQSGTGAIRGYACVAVHARVCLNLNWLHMGNTQTHGVYHFVLQCTADISCTHETFQCAADGERVSGFLCRPEIKPSSHTPHLLSNHPCQLIIRLVMIAIRPCCGCWYPFAAGAGFSWKNNHYPPGICLTNPYRLIVSQLHNQGLQNI
jgi:hypothetical protein